MYQTILKMATPTHFRTNETNRTASLQFPSIKTLPKEKSRYLTDKAHQGFNKVRHELAVTLVVYLQPAPLDTSFFFDILLGFSRHFSNFFLAGLLFRTSSTNLSHRQKRIVFLRLSPSKKDAPKRTYTRLIFRLENKLIDSRLLHLFSPPPFQPPHLMIPSSPSFILSPR